MSFITKEDYRGLDESKAKVHACEPFLSVGIDTRGEKSGQRGLRRLGAVFLPKYSVYLL